MVTAPERELGRRAQFPVPRSSTWMSSSSRSSLPAPVIAPKRTEELARNMRDSCRTARRHGPFFLCPAVSGLGWDSRPYSSARPMAMPVRGCHLGAGRDHARRGRRHGVPDPAHCHRRRHPPRLGAPRPSACTACGATAGSPSAHSWPAWLPTCSAWPPPCGSSPRSPPYQDSSGHCACTRRTASASPASIPPTWRSGQGDEAERVDRVAGQTTMPS